MRVAVQDQSVEATDVVLAHAPPGGGCDAAGGYQPTLTPGEEFTVCGTVTVRIPLLPESIDANTATGQFVVERDRHVDGWRSRAPDRISRCVRSRAGSHRTGTRCPR